MTKAKAKAKAKGCLHAAILLVASCTGTVMEQAGIPGGADEPRDTVAAEDPTSGASLGLPGLELAATVGIRRLTVDEYTNTVRDLLAGNVSGAAQYLPKDSRTPFDNEYKLQDASQALVEGTELLARDLAKEVIADAARRAKVVGCTPTGPGDATCLRQFVVRFGRRAYRRPLTDAEVSTFMRLQSLAVADKNFYSAVEAIIEAFLQDPSFLYRAEVGAPVAGHPGLFKLDDWEMASRLSYFLTGSPPSDTLLDRAATMRLGTPDGVRAAAQGMLSLAKTTARFQRFHALWIGFENAAGALGASMAAETNGLIESYLFRKKRPWQDLLRATETFVSYDLAKLYDLKIPSTLRPDATKGAWVSYAGTPRRGILSHASFLSLARTDSEKLMTIRRGKRIQEVLFCVDVPEKPDNVDDTLAKPPASKCKWDVMEAHRAGGSCAACHSLMDPVGFGLDAYDAQGRFRTTYVMTDVAGNKTPCSVRAEGNLRGSPFSGPVELEDLMLKSGGDLNRCVVTQLYRFLHGKTALDDVDKKNVAQLSQQFGDADFLFDQMLLKFVASNAFAYRRADGQ